MPLSQKSRRSWTPGWQVNGEDCLRSISNTLYKKGLNVCQPDNLSLFSKLHGEGSAAKSKWPFAETNPRNPTHADTPEPPHKKRPAPVFSNGLHWLYKMCIRDRDHADRVSGQSKQEIPDDDRYTQAEKFMYQIFSGQLENTCRTI